MESRLGRRNLTSDCERMRIAVEEDRCFQSFDCMRVFNNSSKSLLKLTELSQCMQNAPLRPVRLFHDSRLLDTQHFKDNYRCPFLQPHWYLTILCKHTVSLSKIDNHAQT